MFHILLIRLCVILFVMNNLVSAIVLAGGKGSRFKGAKQFLSFHGKELWQYPFDIVSRLMTRERIVVVGRDVEGGNTRTASVMNGLRVLPRDTERVIILEAARPLVTEEQVRILLGDDALSSSFVSPLVNTVIGRDGSYYDREKMYNLLTPQAFDFRLLCDAYATGKFTDMTDETRVVFEYSRVKPHLIETGNNLFKVTYPHDISILESIYQNMIQKG